MPSTLWNGPDQDLIALANYLGLTGSAPQQAATAPVAAQPVPQATMPQRAPAASPGAGGGNFFQGISDLFDGGQGRRENKTVNWLMSQGLDGPTAQALAVNPPLLQQYMKDRISAANKGPGEGFTLGEGQTRYDAAGNVIAQGPVKTETEKMTDDLREYQQATKDGFTGTFMDYMVKMKEAGRNQINIDTGVKLPNGYRWKNPENQDAGVEPIPGGPAEEIPAELAARVGMTDSFLGQFDDLKKQIEEGGVTGLWDRAKAGMGIGSQGEVYRRMQSGADALMRLLTGAGMNETEARSYAERYLPTYRDNAESATSKLEQLKRELLSARKMVLRGRGNMAAPGEQDGFDRGVVTDFYNSETERMQEEPKAKRRKFNPATGALE